jgi:hypothetical protein
MAAHSATRPSLDRYVVIHVATTCDEHGVYVTKDSAEVIELGWILVDAKTLEEVGWHTRWGEITLNPVPANTYPCRLRETMYSSSLKTRR